MQKPLTTFRLMMMAVVAIDSLKNLPTNALLGSQLVVYYLIAMMAFFIPSALVSAELATTWPATGGVYIWVLEAFNRRLAFLTVWIQWLIAIIWYPTILSFIAANLSYLVSADLAQNKVYIFLTIQALFWLAIGLASQGLRLSSLVSTLSALLGVMVPMALIIGLGLSWLYTGHASQIKWMDLLQINSLASQDSLRLFITLLFSLMGIEVIAAHAGDVRDPQKDYPRALLAASVIILFTVIPASLAITVVVPVDKISITTSIMDAFIVFLRAFDLQWLMPGLILALAIGSFGIFLTWLLASTRCLLLANQDGSLPGFLRWTNKHGMPVIQLGVQGGVFFVLSCVYLFMPSVNSAYWILTVAAAQFALLYYMLVFIAALRLRSKFPLIRRPFQVGKKPFVFRIVCGLGLVSCLSAFVFGFLPPPVQVAGDTALYEILLLGLILLGCSAGLLIYQSCQPAVGQTIWGE